MNEIERARERLAAPGEPQRSRIAHDLEHALEHGRGAHRRRRVRRPEDDVRNLQHEHHRRDRDGCPRGVAVPPRENRLGHDPDEHARRDEDARDVRLKHEPRDRGQKRGLPQRPSRPPGDEQRECRFRERLGDDRVPDRRRQRGIVRRARDEQHDGQREPWRPELPPDRDEQEYVRGRLQDRQPDPARVRQVVEERTDGDPDQPQHPVEDRAERVAAGMLRRAHEREIGQRTQRDAPVADLIGEQPEVMGDAPGAEQEDIEKGGGRKRHSGRPRPGARLTRHGPTLQHAVSATAPKSASALAIVTGSVGGTPYSRPARARGRTAGRCGSRATSPTQRWIRLAPFPW